MWMECRKVTKLLCPSFTEDQLQVQMAFISYDMLEIVPMILFEHLA